MLCYNITQIGYVWDPEILGNSLIEGEIAKQMNK